MKCTFEELQAGDRITSFRFKNGIPQAVAWTLTRRDGDTWYLRDEKSNEEGNIGSWNLVESYEVERGSLVDVPCAELRAGDVIVMMRHPGDKDFYKSASMPWQLVELRAGNQWWGYAMGDLSKMEYITQNTRTERGLYRVQRAGSAQPATDDRFPHACPYCSKRAYVSALTVEHANGGACK